METTEKECWEDTKTLLGNYKATFGRHWSYNYRNDPKRLPFVLSRYKFAAKMARHKKSIIELGCSDGIGASILAEFADRYVGVDLDQSAIETSKMNLTLEKFNFVHDDFMGKQYGTFETAVSLDVVEHIHPEHEEIYFQTLINQLSENGICIIGTPNATSAPYASEASQIGHVNLFTQQRLKETLERYFHQVFPFGMNDEIVHTGYAPMCHYIFCVACHLKEGR
jgi:2-polyprenyl-3-methyl-5-hydroxy-6-metoxy-1,4-benzoquinol methylase